MDSTQIFPEAPSSPEEATTLRQRADLQIAGLPGQLSVAQTAQLPQAVQDRLDELEVRRIELEMQNAELRRTQAALEEAQARYFDFCDLAPVGYLTVSDKAVILQANLKTTALLGLPRDQLIGKVLTRFMFSPDADDCDLLCKRILASDSTQCFDVRLRKTNGNTIWVKLQAIATTAQDGAAVIRMVMSDITGRKQAEAALMANSQLTTAILDSIPSQIAVLDYAGTIVSVNQGWRQFALN